ncbi:MAG: helicase-associated domain-containing protein [Thermomicrobiales bacterium]|nr:helicase-associated domain-containing protein [Thermomicrobiales bacterium]
MPRSVKDILTTYDNPSLTQMIRFHSLPITEKTKARMVAALAPVIVDPRLITNTLNELSDPAQALLDCLIQAGGSASSGVIRRKLERAGAIDPRPKPVHGGYYSYAQPARGSTRNPKSRKFEDVVAWLGMAGLVFTSRPARSSRGTVEIFSPGQLLFIPPQILKHLPPVELTIETVGNVVDVGSSDPSTLLRDLYLFVSLAAREKIVLTNRGSINKRSMLRINQELTRQEDVSEARGEDDTGWLSLLRALAQEVKLLAPTAGELLADPRAGDFLRLPPGVRRSMLFAAYRTTQRWCEVFRVPGLTIRAPGASIRVSPDFAVDARRRVLEEIASLPMGEWVAVDHLIDRVGAASYEFLLSRQMGSYNYGYGGYYGSSDATDLPNPYNGINEAGWTFEGIRDEGQGWERVEAGFIRVLAIDVLPAFGVVDLGRQENGALAIRLTNDGLRLLRDEPLPDIPAESNVVIQPNFQIFAFQPTGDDVLFALDQMADRIRTDQAVEYELTRRAFNRGLRAGYDTAGIIAFLASVSNVDLPQNVRRTLEEWGSQTERITVRSKTPLLQVADEATLDALYADREFTPLLGGRLGPTIALVPEESLVKFSERLISTGRFPALTEGAEESSRRRIDVDGDGRLTFLQSVPSIYDVRLITPLVDPDASSLRMTESSLRRSAKSGLGAEAVLAILEQLHGGPLPPEAAAFVRRWTKDWGSGALFDATILQVDQPETLNDLLSDPETGPCLTRLAGSQTLALVVDGASRTLRKLLAERGMMMDSGPRS